MSEIVYITGHKNPDTDSICSCIAYAELKQKQGIPAVPVRIGNINRETKFVLNYFGVPEPDYLETVKTQVSDLNLDRINPVSQDISIKTAWMIMKKNNRRILPVADESGKFLGLITLSDITRNYMDTLESNILSASKTPLRNITETLKANLATKKEKECCFTGKVVIVAMEPDNMAPFVEQGDIVLIGSRKSSQRKAIELGVSCLILTCGEKADGEILELAEKSGCIVMETNYDTFSAARLIYQSIPVGYIMTKKDLVSFRPNDFIDSIREKMIQTRYRSYPVVDEDGSVKGFISRYHLLSSRRKQVILLDHNEKMQTVDGIDEAEILEIIDHHRIGDIQTVKPIHFKNDMVGSTATLIASMYFENGIRPEKKTAGILYSAIVSDTLNFSSPTTTRLDRNTADQLAEYADLDTENFASQMFQAGSVLKGLSVQEILNYDFKEYTLNGCKVGIGQVNSMDASETEQMRGPLLRYIGQARQEKGYGLLLLMITDVIKKGSYVLYAGENASLPRVAFKETESPDGAVFLDGVISRKKQVVPLISDATRSLAMG